MTDNPYINLTWDDLELWASSKIVSRGRNYQRNGHVKDIALTSDNSLIAWVQGTQKYVTLVSLTEDAVLEAVCTCPYWAVCKHAVAVVLEYLKLLEGSHSVPIVDNTDPRLVRIQGTDEMDEDFNGEGRTSTSDSLTKKLQEFIRQQTKSQLIDLLTELSDEYFSVRKFLQDRLEMSRGSVKELVQSTRREIINTSAEPGWQNYWENEGYTPDYSRVNSRLKKLLEMGSPDEVLVLGKELFRSGIKQVEMSDDEGETAIAVSNGLDIVLKALPQSSFPDWEKMRWLIELELEDEYDLLGSNAFWRQKFNKKDWSALADCLLTNLAKLPEVTKKEDFSTSYHRDNLTDKIIWALKNAGRKDEIIPLCEKEVKITSNYERLVRVLMEAGRIREMENWIYKGIKDTEEKWPGIAANLRIMLMKIRKKQRDWNSVAAIQAEEFFHNPSLHTYKDMRKAAKKAKVWSSVRQFALHFLETGKMPMADIVKGKSTESKEWPLPKIQGIYTTRRKFDHFPHNDTLIDIAIYEKKPEEVLRWYEVEYKQKNHFYMSEYRGDEIANALKKTHPEETIHIWCDIVHQLINMTKVKSYQSAAQYIRKIRDILESSDQKERWYNYLKKIRQEHFRKRRLMEILDVIEKRHIIG